MTAERQKQIEAMAEKAFPERPKRTFGYNVDDQLYNDMARPIYIASYIKGASEVLDAVDWNTLELKLFLYEKFDIHPLDSQVKDLIEYLNNNIILKPKNI